MQSPTPEDTAKMPPQKKKTSELSTEPPNILINPATPPTRRESEASSTISEEHDGRVVRRDQVPELMRTNSNKRILNQRPLNLPTKTLRMKSLLWVKPSVTKSQLSNSVFAQVG